MQPRGDLGPTNALSCQQDHPRSPNVASSRIWPCNQFFKSFSVSAAQNDRLRGSHASSCIYFADRILVDTVPGLPMLLAAEVLGLIRAEQFVE